MRVRSAVAPGLAFALALCSNLAFPAFAQDGAALPAAEMPCNDVCRWWMAIGRSPEAALVDPRPAAPTNPRPSMKAIALATPEPPARPISISHLWTPSPNRESPARRVARGPVSVPAPPRTSDDRPSAAAAGMPVVVATSRGGWNAPIGGSAAVLTTAFVRP